MSETFIDGLFVSSMIFFNIFCIIGIIAGIVLIVSILAIRKHTVSTLDSVKETTDNIGGITKDIRENWIPAVAQPKQKSWVDIVLKLIKK